MPKLILKLTLIIALAFTNNAAFAQSEKEVVDQINEARSQTKLYSLKQLVNPEQPDTTRVRGLGELSNYYRLVSPDSARYYGEQGIKLAREINDKDGELFCLGNLSAAWWSSGDYETAIRILLPRAGELNSSKKTTTTTTGYVALMINYRELGDYAEALKYTHLLEDLRIKSVGQIARINTASQADLHFRMRHMDSARYLIRKAFTYPGGPGMTGWPYFVAGEIFKHDKNYDSAYYYYRMSLPVLEQEGNKKDVAGLYVSLSDLFKQIQKKDSSRFYAYKAARLASEKKFAREYVQALRQLASSYKGVDSDSALHYMTMANDANDSLFSLDKQIKLSSFRINESLRLQEIDNARSAYRSQVQKLVLGILMVISLMVGLMLWRNNRNKQRSNERLQFQKMQTENALEELKAAQAQLIQSEKMASLGELTAGIAHEIQNPLNFVNNFSQLNTELATEGRDAIKSGNWGDAEDVLSMLAENNDKILQHGKRAEAIVKGMLQHTRTSSGVKEPTDINALADEYLRLAYHGFCAKEKNFRGEYRFYPDPALEKVNIVPQDMGRVLLNLINNAFFAVNERSLSGGTTYQPLVELSTARSGNNVIITVKDNGKGIAANIKDKIFQPFFTTKPTGEGTGLGLSLSYDIVKAHGGELKLKTTEGEGAEFILQLPSN
jgi:two-component system NtrC family sensor kinase